MGLQHNVLFWLLFMVAASGATANNTTNVNTTAELGLITTPTNFSFADPAASVATVSTTNVDRAVELGVLTTSPISSLTDPAASVATVSTANVSKAVEPSFMAASLNSSLSDPGQKHKRNGVYFDSTTFDTYPDCSKTCITDNLASSKAACGSTTTPSDVYSECVCREDPGFQIAAASCMAKTCHDELRPSAKKFCDTCANTGYPASLNFTQWLAQGNMTGDGGAIGSSAPSTTGSVSTSTSSTSPIDTTSPASKPHSGLSTDQKIAIPVPIAIISGAILAAIITCYFARRKRRSRTAEGQAEAEAEVDGMELDTATSNTSPRH